MAVVAAWKNQPQHVGGQIKGTSETYAWASWVEARNQYSIQNIVCATAVVYTATLL
jgi:hypothetical protein